MKSFLTAGFALATCAAWAVVSENFDDATEIPSGFTGGTLEAAGSGATGKVLAYDSTVTCANDSNASESEFVKTTFKVLAPADGTEVSALPTGTEVSGCQIAVATGPETEEDNPKLKVYVYAMATSGSTATWQDTGLTVAKEQYFSATLNFDYSKATKTATLRIGNAEVGPYTLVKSLTAETYKINSLAFVGSSKLDEVAIDEAVAQNSLPTDLQGFTLYTADLGITTSELSDTTTKYNGLTVAEQIQAGITPKSETTFMATGLATVTEDNAVKTQVTVPCNMDNGQVYQIAITDASDKAIEDSPVSATAGAISESQRTLTFTVPSTSKKVLKFQVQAKAPSAS